MTGPHFTQDDINALQTEGELARERRVANDTAAQPASLEGGMSRTKYTDGELLYSATARCPCGEGLAYPEGIGLDARTPDQNAWDCAGILTGRAIPKGDPGSVQHTARLPFVFYEIKSEGQPSAQGATTRP
jgi:hypothetical protein